MVPRPHRWEGGIQQGGSCDSPPPTPLPRTPPFPLSSPVRCEGRGDPRALQPSFERARRGRPGDGGPSEGSEGAAVRRRGGGSGAAVRAAGRRSGATRAREGGGLRPFSHPWVPLVPGLSPLPRLGGIQGRGEREHREEAETPLPLLTVTRTLPSPLPPPAPPLLRVEGRGALGVASPGDVTASSS